MVIGEFAMSSPTPKATRILGAQGKERAAAAKVITEMQLCLIRFDF